MGTAVSNNKNIYSPEVLVVQVHQVRHYQDHLHPICIKHDVKRNEVEDTKLKALFQEGKITRVRDWYILCLLRIGLKELEI